MIAGSAGSLQVIVKQLQRLRFHTEASVFVIYHRMSNGDFHLADFVGGCELTVTEAVHGSAVLADHVHHPKDDSDLTVVDGRLLVTVPTQRHHPNIDLLMSSLAEAYGARVVGVLLSGMGTDGLVGLRDIRKGGGKTAVQSPGSSMFPQLPEAAITAGLADRVLNVGQLHKYIEGILRGPHPRVGALT